MPRPSPNHQWSNNKSGLPVVDVVVDPHLTTHLRPHQRDGLLFLYECVMGLRYYGCSCNMSCQMSEPHGSYYFVVLRMDHDLCV